MHNSKDAAPCVSIGTPASLELGYVRPRISSDLSFLATLLATSALLFAGSSLAAQDASNPADPSSSPNIQIQTLDVEKQKVAVVDPAAHQPLNVAKGENFGPWTLMAVIQEPEGTLAVFEELKDRRGSIIYVGKGGLVLNLPKSLGETET